MKRLKIFQVDFFCDRPFGGNPAGVSVLDEAISDHLIQSIAGEMELVVRDDRIYLIGQAVIVLEGEITIS